MLTAHRLTLLPRRAVFVVLGVLVSMGLAGTTHAQTDTPTATATATPTVTHTPTLAIPATPGSSDQAAWKYGAFVMPTPVCPTPASNLVTIPGLKQGDLFVVYPDDSYRGGVSQRILTNNTARVNLNCTTAGSGSWQYIWYNRTQNNCQGAPNCGPAPTVTPTP